MKAASGSRDRFKSLLPFGLACLRFVPPFLPTLLVNFGRIFSTLAELGISSTMVERWSKGGSRNGRESKRRVYFGRIGLRREDRLASAGAEAIERVHPGGLGGTFRGEPGDDLQDRARGEEPYPRGGGKDSGRVWDHALAARRYRGAEGGDRGSQRAADGDEGSGHRLRASGALADLRKEGSRVHPEHGPRRVHLR